MVKVTEKKCVNHKVRFYYTLTVGSSYQKILNDIF
jgi:hypothetical protein